MANFTDLFIRRPVLATVVSLIILILGLRALSELPLRQFPKMENSVITVQTSYPGANAELIQGYITSRIQKAIAGADGIDYIAAKSTDGLSQITAYIKLNYNPSVAMTDIMAKVAEVRNDLPKESNQPVIEKATGSQMALMYIGFKSQSMTTQQITDYLVRVIRPKMQTVGGVANAEILGGQTYAMRIWLDTEKMAAFNIATTDIITSLNTENFQTAAGQIKGQQIIININAKTDLKDQNQFENIIIKRGEDTLIRLKDVAKVELGAENYDSSVIFNGMNAVFIGIFATPTANPLTVIRDVKSLLPELALNYPPNFEAKIVYDSTEYIRSSIHEVITTITEATIIVIIVIFLFLGAIRSVLIPVVTIPLSLIGVCFLLLTMGYSLNLLTLLAMVLAIGLVVDDAIVVVENIYRHIEEGFSPLDAAIKGAREIASPIISMTTTLAAVYAPIGFMTGVTGALFKEFAFTLAFSVIISGVIALTLSPMMCSKILSSDVSHKKLVHRIDVFFEKLKNYYFNALSQTLNYKKVVVVFSIIILATCVLLALTTPTELAPEEDQSVLFVSLTGPEYANLQYTTTYTQRLNSIYQNIPETEDYFILNGLGAANNAISGLILKPWHQRKKSQSAVNGLLHEKLRTIPGLNAVSFPLPSIPGSNDGLPLQFVLTSTSDHLVINQVLERLQQTAMQSGLFMFLDNNLKFEKPELEIDIDRNKAGLMGVSIADIGNTLQTLLGGNYVNRFSREGQSYVVIPQIPDVLRLNPRAISTMYVTTKDSENLIPLDSLVTTQIRVIPNQLNTFQQLNSATLQGMMMPGKSLSDGLAFLREKAIETFPSGVGFDYAGQSRQLIHEGNEILYTFFFALLIIYLVLSAQFESFRDPFIILISVPMSIAGALIPLQLGFATLNIYTGIGLVTLIGLISKHGILIVDFANKIRIQENLSATEAVIRSASLRLRPILMTTAAMVLGVIPLLFASGAGAVSRYDIGLVITTGMLVGTGFTLFVVPTMYTLLSAKRNK